MSNYSRLRELEAKEAKRRADNKKRQDKFMIGKKRVTTIVSKEVGDLVESCAAQEKISVSDWLKGAIDYRLSTNR